MFAKLRQKTIDEKASPAKAGSPSDGLQRRDSVVDATVQAKTSPPAHYETPSEAARTTSSSRLDSTADARSQPAAGIDGQEDLVDGSTASHRGPRVGVGVGEDLPTSDRESPISQGTQPGTSSAGQEGMLVPRTSSVGPAVQGEYPSSSPPPDLTSETQLSPLRSVETKSSPATSGPLAPTPVLPAPTSGPLAPTPVLPAPTSGPLAPTPVLSAPTSGPSASLLENSSPSPQPLGDDGETKETMSATSGLGEKDLEMSASLEKVSHEELVTMFVKQRLTAQRYKGRFSEVMEAYRKLEKDKGDYTEREKRLNRKLQELKEVQELDHQAKVHMEETMRLSMEEKDEKINVLTTQIRLLKELQSGSEVAVRDDAGKQQLKQKLSEYETTLTKYRDGLRLAKEKILQLQKEKDSLVGELKAKTEELEQKEVHSTAAAIDSGSATGGGALEKGSRERVQVVAEPDLDQGLRSVQLEKKLEESKSSCVQLERALEESRTSYVQLEKRFQEHSTALNKSKVELEKKLEESKSSCVQLEKLLQESRTSYVQLEKRSEEEQNSLKAQYEIAQLQLREQNDVLQRDMNHLKYQTETCDRELRSARQSLEESREGFNQRSQLTDEANHRLQSEVMQLREQVASLRVNLEARSAAMLEDGERLTREWEAKMAFSLAGKETEYRCVLDDRERRHAAVLSDREARHMSELSSLKEELGRALWEQQTKGGSLTLALQDARCEITSLLDQVTNGLNELQRCKAKIGVLEEERERERVTHEGVVLSLREEHSREMRDMEERWKSSCHVAVEEKVRLLEEEKLGHARELAVLRDKMATDLEQKREEWAKAEVERREMVVALEAKVAGLASENRAALSRVEVARREEEASVKSLQLEMDALVAGKEQRLTEVAASLRDQVDSLRESQRQLRASYDEVCREHAELLSRHESEVRGRREVAEELALEVQSRKQEAQGWESRLAQVTHSYLEKEDQLTKRLKAEQEKSEGVEAEVCSIKNEVAQKLGELEAAHSSKLQELGRRAETLKTTQATQAEELASLQGSLNVERGRVQRQGEEHVVALEALRASHRQQVEDLVRAHRDEVKRLAESHGVHLMEMEQAHAALLVAQKREAESTLQTRLAEKENELRVALASKEEELSSVRAALEVDLVTLKETHVSELASHLEKHRSELDKMALLHREASRFKERLEVELEGVRGELARSQLELTHSASRCALEKESLEGRLRAQQSEMDILVANHGSSHDSVVAECRQELENLACQVQEAKEETKVLQEQHEVAMSQLKAEHKKALQSRGEQHEVAMSQLKAEHKKALQSRDEQHEVAMSQLKAGHEKALQSRGEQHEVAMSQLKAEHEKALQSRGEQHEIAMSQLKAEHEGLLASQRQTVVTDVGKQVKEVEGQWKERARKLREEVKKLLATNSELEAKLGSFEVRLKEGDVRTQALTAEVVTFKETIGRLEVSLKAKEEELVAVITQREVLESQAEEKRLDLKKKAESKIAALKKQLAAAQLEQVASMEGGREGYEQLKKENAQLREELGSLHRTLDAQKVTGEEELCSMRQALDRKEEEVEDLAGKVGNLADRAQVAEKRSVELEQECSRLGQELATLKVTAESLQSENLKLGHLKLGQQELVDKVSVQETQRHALEDHVQNLCVEVSSLQVAMKLERQTNEGLVGRLRREVEEAERLTLATEEEWKGRLDKVLAEVNFEREQLIQEHRRRIQEVLVQVQTLQEQLGACQGDRDKARGQLERSRQEGGQKVNFDMVEAKLSLVAEDSEAVCDGMKRTLDARVAQCQSELAARDRLLAEQSVQHREELVAMERKMERQLLEEQARVEELQERLAEVVGRKQAELEQQARLVRDTGSCDIAGLTQLLAEARTEAQLVKVALATEEEKSFKLQERLADMRSKQEGEMDALKQYNKQQLSVRVAEKTAELRAQYEEAISALEERHSEELRNIRAQGGGDDTPGLLQLQGLVRRCKDDIQMKESECLHLKGENQTLKLQRLTARPSGAGAPATPTRPDTPSKHVVLDSEPHGAEFEYFKNVLFQFLMGKQSKQLVKAIATLARFSDKQKGDIYSRLDI